jgi:hypothetical protein
MSKGKKKLEIYGSDIRKRSSMKGSPWTGGSFLADAGDAYITYTPYVYIVRIAVILK